MGAHLLPKLRCHFAEFLNQSSLKRLGILSPPTWVGLRYGLLVLNLEAFLGSMGWVTSALRHGITSRPWRRADLPTPQAYTLAPTRPTVGWPTLLRPSVAHTNRYRNINLFSISYAFRPRLRDRLTLGRLTLPRKPWAYGERVSHPFYRYLCQHYHFPLVQQALQPAFIPSGNAPLPSIRRWTRGFGTMLSSVTFSAQDH